jgi:GNAT superfamily N-acetyltransferase
MVRYFSPQTVLELSQKRQMLVAIDDSKIVGTGSLQNDTVYSLFVDPDQIGKGVGKQLMQELEELAKNNHVTLLKVPSSLTAIGFYTRLGFVKEKEVLSEGSDLTIEMTKKL